MEVAVSKMIICLISQMQWQWLKVWFWSKSWKMPDTFSSQPKTTMTRRNCVPLPFSDPAFAVLFAQKFNDSTEFAIHWDLLLWNDFILSFSSQQLHIHEWTQSFSKCALKQKICCFCIHNFGNSGSTRNWISTSKRLVTQCLVHDQICEHSHWQVHWSLNDWKGHFLLFFPTFCTAHDPNAFFPSRWLAWKIC